MEYDQLALIRVSAQAIPQEPVCDLFVAHSDFLDHGPMCSASCDDAPIIDVKLGVTRAGSPSVGKA